MTDDELYDAYILLLKEQEYEQYYTVFETHTVIHCTNEEDLPF